MTLALRNNQIGYTLIELIITISIIGILATIAVISYQKKIRQTQLITIYQEVNQFRLPYQTLIDNGEAVTAFNPDGLNMPIETRYCQFTVISPNKSGTTLNAVRCEIQNLNYLQNQQLSLDRSADGSWICKASSGIAKAYLPKDCQ